jgi:membrane fusion protein (multidrug efflux system)
VYVVQDNIARLKPIKIGTVTQEQVEIVEGLAAGEKVVRSGQINLQDGTKVTAL